VPLHKIADRESRLDLSKGPTARLTPGGQTVAMEISPVTGAGPQNYYGLH
jgi:hypothetical protein